MNRILALFLLQFLLWSTTLRAFYSIAELKADALKKDPSIKIRVQRSADQITFIVGLRKSDHPEVYWHGSVDLVDREGTVLGRVEMRGEDVRRSLDERTQRNWGWQDFKPAEVFRFTVATTTLAQSKFTWETGPRNDEHGVDYGGGIIRWSYLQGLADAAENANKIGAANGNQPIRSQANRTSSAAGNRR